MLIRVAAAKKGKRIMRASYRRPVSAPTPERLLPPWWQQRDMTASFGRHGRIGPVTSRPMNQTISTTVRLACWSAIGLALPIVVRPAAAAVPSPVQEAWWTGPMLASSGGTLPKGHVLAEPYLFDQRGEGGDYAGSLTYLLYGATDRLTVGLIPTFGAAHSDASPHSRHAGVSDLTLTAQYRMHQAQIGEAMPTWSLVVQESLPTGRFDRLGGDADRGIGSGTFATMIGLYAQRSDALPSGHLVRTRLNLSYTMPHGAHVRDRSVFGTPDSFRGTAHPGDSALIDLAFEYSLTRNWVLATDLFARRTGAGDVGGVARDVAWSNRLPRQRSAGVAPAIEYNWSASRGILLGLRRIFPGHNVAPSWTARDRLQRLFLTCELSRSCRRASGRGPSG